MAAEAGVDKQQVRRSFDQAAAGYDAAAVVQHEVCRRMFERLEYIRSSPRAILDAGSGTGNALPKLAQRYAGVPLIALDLAPGMLEVGRRRLRWWERLPGLRPPVFAVCADLEALPLAPESMGLVWSNLSLQWLNDLPKAFAEIHHVLAPGGLLMFSTFGPDTLKELRNAFAAADAHTHVNSFVDMHDIGDTLVAARFADPVMDMETIIVTYDRVRDLMRDLKAIGAHNVTRGRPAGLLGKSTLGAAERAYEKYRHDGKLPATFEVVYGHAWKPETRVGPAGHRIIDVKPV